ncbi:MAG TPA: LacI family DNA-binding transcriptional regulator [Solirubrobacteraceae bacterium]|nr:LacI family DNA-binding transcriptional regulator [Solirubrobacteraceae bacterium]
MASLADISRQAGVSIATASRVLNGSAHPVSEATRARVLAAADELGYRPSELARALVKRTSRIVGVIVGDIVDPYFAEIARGVEDVAARVGHLTMVCNSDRRPTAELAHLDVLRDYHAAGVVFAGSGYQHAAEEAALQAAVEALVAGGSAVVALAARDLDCPSVLVDNRGAARDATEHLLALGHRRIAFVEGPPGLHTSAHRLEGFEAAIGDAGAEGVRLPGGFEYEAGAAAAEALMADLPDAVLGVNDEVAIGVLTALRGGGVDVPGRVSVAGIDDTRPARLVDLTSVSLPLHELGEMAARVVLEGAPGDIVLPHRLVPRATTARSLRSGP